MLEVLQVVGVAIVLVAAARFALLRLLQYWRPVSPDLVSPPLTSFLGHIDASKSAQEEHWIELFEKYSGNGLGVNLSLFGLGMIFLTSPEAARHVMVTNSKNYIKPVQHVLSGYNELVVLLGTGLLLAEGEVWKSHRRAFNPAFAGRFLKALIPGFTRQSNLLVNELLKLNGQPIEIQTELTKATVDIIGEAAFGQDFGSLTDMSARMPRAVFLTLQELQRRITEPWHSLVNRQAAQTFDRELAYIRSTTQQIIEQRRKDGISDEDKSILAFILRAQAAQGANVSEAEKITDENVIDEAMTFLIAGHETTATALTWTFYLLLKHQDIFDRLLVEVDTVMNECQDAPTAETLNSFVFMEKVLNESLRLYPPIPSVGRFTVEDDVISGIRIPKGAIVTLSFTSVHRNKAIWGPDANEFRPDRWDDVAHDSAKLAAFMPFALGPRQCIGLQFAQMEMKVLLAVLLRRLSFSFAKPHNGDKKQFLTIRPSPLEVYATKRHQTD